MINYFRGIKLGIAITSGLLITCFLVWIGLRIFSMVENQEGCWSIKTESLFVDVGSQPSCYQRETPIK